MAPRIRLNIGKPLPTINEALEDILEEKTSNTKGVGNVYMCPHSCSGEDYLQSICQLARPTFPLPLLESKRKAQDTDKLGVLHHSKMVFNLPETPKIMSKCKLTDTLPNLKSLERNCFILDHIKTDSNSKANPLEEMYTKDQKTHQWGRSYGSENTGPVYPQYICYGTHLSIPQEKTIEKQDVVDFPRLLSPRPVQRENSCPELKSLKNHARMPTLKNGPNQNENDPLIVNGKSIWLYAPRENPLDAKILRPSQRGQQTLKGAAFLEREHLKPSLLNPNVKKEMNNREGYMEYFYIDQKATSRHWISEYQCAWKEAKVRACLLPAIAES
ncbi:uncharacterized protein LOC128341733 [Hemicordylus capensis]|uniref:uncharacterized protein LOC128341733 n=1 Tax=Hemicordylus capensis TaxID=884348 RepID=UPI0023045AF2|nr:uncharacterized protein LOC128341733 [Hemicordylus capensis]